MATYFGYDIKFGNFFFFVFFSFIQRYLGVKIKNHIVSAVYSEFFLCIFGWCFIDLPVKIEKNYFRLLFIFVFCVLYHDDDEAKNFTILFLLRDLIAPIFAWIFFSLFVLFWFIQSFILDCSTFIKAFYGDFGYFVYPFYFT